MHVGNMIFCCPVVGVLSVGLVLGRVAFIPVCFVVIIRRKLTTAQKAFDAT